MSPVKKILEKYFTAAAPNLIAIDVEGLDLEILKSLDCTRYQPEVICVEILLYDENQNGYKNEAIIDFMLSQQYKLYADTRVNAIFCRQDIFK